MSPAANEETSHQVTPPAEPTINGVPATRAIRRLSRRIGDLVIEKELAEEYAEMLAERIQALQPPPPTSDGATTP